MLILTTLSLDFRAGIALGCMTPLVAVIRGQLPPILFPMAPFIMVGNALYVTIFYFIYYYHTRKIEYPLKSVRAWIGLILGAFLKFVFLYAAVHFIMPFLLGKTFPNVVLAAMSFPQFITAMVGGILAFVIFSLLKKSFFIK
jgi:hypothetical protein